MSNLGIQLNTTNLNCAYINGTPIASFGGGGNVTFVDLAPATAPTSTSTTSAATANSLTNAYNSVASLLLPSASTFGTSAAAAINIGSTAQSLVMQGLPTGTSSLFNNFTTGTINIATVISGGAINIGSSATGGTITIGGSAGNTILNRVSTIACSPTLVSTNICTGISTGTLNIATGITSTGIVNLCTAATGAYAFNIGTAAQGTINLNTPILNYGGLNANVSSIATTSSKVTGLPQVATFALTNETATVIANTTTPAIWWRIPYGWKILGVRASVYTPSSSGAITIQIQSVSSGTAIATSTAAGTNIFSTNLTIDATKTSSIGSATAAVLTTAANTTGLADDTGLSVFITTAGVGSAGLKLLVYYTQF